MRNSVQAALNANTGGTPNAAITRPAIAGPTARATLTLTMSRRVAAAICDRGTSSVMSGCQAGSWIALPTPIANVNASSSSGGTRCIADSSDSMDATTTK